MKLNYAFLWCLLFLTINLNAQGENYTEEIKNTYDSILGYKNLSLLNGVEIINENRTLTDKHQFFIDRDFLKGDLIYRGEKYSNLNLRYDIFKDVLQVKLDKNVSGTLLMELIKAHVNSFSLNGSTFKNLVIDNREFDSGFYEVLFNERDLSLYKKRRLKRLDKEDKEFLYYEFQDLSNVYILYTPKTGYFEATTSRLRKKLPDCYTSFSDYIRKNRRIRKQDPDSYWKGLSSLINKSECLENTVSK